MIFLLPYAWLGSNSLPLKNSDPAHIIDILWVKFNWTFKILYKMVELKKSYNQFLTNVVCCLEEQNENE